MKNILDRVNINSKITCMVFVILCLIIHTMYLVVFAILGAWILFFIDLLSVLFYSFYTVKFRNNADEHILWAYYEIIIFAGVNEVILGNRYGFYLYIFGMVAVICFLDTNYTIRKLAQQFLGLIIAVAVVYISENKLLYIESQEIKLVNYQEYFLIGNVIITIFLLMLMCLLYMIERNRLQRKLEFYVNHDALTGVYNRRAFDYIVKDSIKEKYVIAMVDIDDFKKINDCYGHKLGDTAIVKVADVLSSNPMQDAVIRWGGEEFVVFFPESDIDVIYKEMDGVRKKIAQLRIQSGLKEFGLSVTVGLAQGTSKNDYEKVINLADEKLYIGKNNGKNTVVK